MAFLDYYRENLICLRQIAAEFAAEFPKIAARLELSESECRDPYVERLLEGTAFLAGRVEQKLESGFPRLLESILSAVSPASLYPIPSFCVLELQPQLQDERLKKGYRLPAGSEFQCLVPGVRTPCTFSTLREAALHPLAVVGAEYCTRELGAYPIASRGVQAALSVRMERSDGGRIADNPPDELSFFLNLPEGEASQLQEQLTGDSVELLVGDGEHFQPVTGYSLELPMTGNPFSGETPSDRMVEGLQLLQRFLAYPAAFKFIELKGIRECLRQVSGSSVELVFCFKRRIPTFVNELTRDKIRLDCVLAANLFRRRSERSSLGGQYETHLVPDRTAPLDYEVFKVLSVEVFNDRNETMFQCRDFYDQSGRDGRNRSDFFSQHRKERLVSRERLARSSYPGTEVFLSFSGENWREHWDKASQFQAEMYCTNRDLPLLVRLDSRLNVPPGTPLDSAQFITAPGRPSDALIRGGAGADWDKIGHIAFNLSSALWRPGAMPAVALKSLIRAYSVRNEDETQRLLDGILELRTEPHTFRFIRNGCVFYESGWRVHLTLGETQYAGTGHFLFASVLRKLLTSYTPLNSCVELMLHTDRNAEGPVWNL